MLYCLSTCAESMQAAGAGGAGSRSPLPPPRPQGSPPVTAHCGREMGREQGLARLSARSHWAVDEGARAGGETGHRAVTRHWGGGGEGEARGRRAQGRVVTWRRCSLRWLGTCPPNVDHLPDFLLGCPVSS